MSVEAAGPVRRHGPWFDRFAMLAIGVVIVGAALVPAVTANAGGTITIHGDVTEDGRPLAFFPVGFWTPTGSQVAAHTTTDANGGFTLDVSATIDGFAYAGTAPDAQQAVVTVDGRQVVRGVIGAKAATPVSSPIYQGQTTATGHGLAGSAADVHFLLQAPGRITGTSPVRGSALHAVQVRRLDGSVVQTLRVDARGRYTSEPLAPGDYGVALVPAAPLLPVAARATVTGGGTTAVVLPTPVTGAEIDGTITSDRTAAASVVDGVPVLLEQGGVVTAATTSGSGGVYRFAGLAAGVYTVELGRSAAVGSSTAAGAATAPAAAPAATATASAASTPAVSIPGVTATTTPTAAPTPSATASTGAEAALEPLQRTASAVLPGTATVTVPSTLGEVALTTALPAAGTVSGTITGVGAAGAQVVAEDPSTGRILRAATATATGRYTIGGLEQGAQYVVAAVSRPADPVVALAGSTSALATAATTGVDVALRAPASTLTGTVDGAKTGTVTVGDPLAVVRTATIDASGAFVVRGLVPGAYPVTVATTGRLVSDPVGVVVPAGSGTQDLSAGPSAAQFQGWFISGGAGVPRVVGTATGVNGVIAFGPGTSKGHVTVRGARPGTYAYDADAFVGTAPAADGPWWFTAPTGSFVLNSGPTDVGPIVLHLRSR